MLELRDGAVDEPLLDDGALLPDEPVDEDVGAPVDEPDGDEVLPLVDDRGLLLAVPARDPVTVPAVPAPLLDDPVALCAGAADAAEAGEAVIGSICPVGVNATAGPAIWRGSTGAIAPVCGADQEPCSPGVCGAAMSFSALAAWVC